MEEIPTNGFQNQALGLHELTVFFYNFPTVLYITLLTCDASSQLELNHEYKTMYVFAPVL